MTTAQKIADQFYNDGERWTDAEDNDLDDVCDENCSSPDYGHLRTRWIFADGSAITSAGNGWDLGYSDCWCWQSVGHNEDCMARN